MRGIPSAHVVSLLRASCRELHDFAVGPLPAVMWANPSTDFTISFGQPADALVVTTGQSTYTLLLIVSDSLEDG